MSEKWWIFRQKFFFQFFSIFCAKTPWNSFWVWISIIFTILAHLTSWNGQIWHFLSVLVIFGDFCSRQFLGGIVVPKSQFLDSIWKFRFRRTSGYPRFIWEGRTYNLKMASKKFWIFDYGLFGCFCSNLTIDHDKCPPKWLFAHFVTVAAI